jgi:hypothetical protein
VAVGHAQAQRPGQDRHAPALVARQPAAVGARLGEQAGATQGAQVRERRSGVLEAHQVPLEPVLADLGAQSRDGLEPDHGHQRVGQHEDARHDQHRGQAAQPDPAPP